MIAIHIITIFPEMLTGFLNESMMKRAANAEHVSFATVDLRDFTDDAHRTTDDRPYGGGPGMLMKPEPIFRAVESIRKPDSRVILMSPQGRPFDQSCAQRLSNELNLIFICGHYEGIDERIREDLVDEEISIGDYILTNGALAAAVVTDALVRLIPGVLGAGPDATETESFSTNSLEYPQYTRPAIFRGKQVPEVLLSGDHGKIADWRARKAKERTEQRRPDLSSGL